MDKLKMYIKISVLTIVLLLSGFSEAAKRNIDLSNAKLAVHVDIKDLSKQVSLGMTVFGNHYGEAEDLNYQMPEYLTEHLDRIFTKLGVNYAFVEKTELSNDELAGLKNREQRKLQEKHQDAFIERLKEKKYTDLMTFNFFKQALKPDATSLRLPNLNGYGVYKVPGAHCIYHTLGYIHTNIKRPKKPRKYEVTKNIPEKEKFTYLCRYGVDAKKMGIQWLEDTDDYTQEEQALVEKTIKNLVLESLLDTFLRQGIIESQLQANQLYIEFTQSDYLVVEKLSNDEFQIGNQNYSANELIQYLASLAKEDSHKKVLVGYQTKSSYTFGDLKRIFIPATENTSITLYRLGPEYGIIEI
ncbi:MAG: hypothetical protein ACK5L8_08070 [Marinicella pacifica]